MAREVKRAALWDFYPRPPRGGRHHLDAAYEPLNQFLSTPSARRATYADYTSWSPFAISIHALREEGDLLPGLMESIRAYFYPRPPRGGRRSSHWGLLQSKSISIHALREEGDFPLAQTGLSTS